MGDLATEVERFSRRSGLFAPGTTVVVGVSGGPDSLCLLHVLRRLAPVLGIRLHVGHFNHGLRGAQAAADAQFVARVAADWGLPYHLGHGDVRSLAQAGKLSVEEAARHARYAFLAATARSAGASAVAVGHTADDQAETVLMHFLRGSGPAGLRGMLPRSPLLAGHGDDRPGDLVVVRPLLETTRSQTVAYCAAEGLAPRSDSSNEDTAIYRNRLRHELMPELARYNPAIRTVLARTAAVMAGDYDVLSWALQDALARVEVPGRPGEIVFDRAAWLLLPLGLQRATLRHAVQRLRRTLRNVNWEHVERALWLAREGHAGQSATLVGGLAMTVDYDTLRVAGEEQRWDPALHPVPQLTAPVPLRAGQPVELSGGWTVTARWFQAEDLAAPPPAGPWTARLDAEAVGQAPSLRPRRPGDRFQPQGLAGHSMKLNEFFINAKVPRPVRDGWPLLAGSAGIAWVCGLRVAEWAALRPDSRQVWEVTIERSP